MHSAAMSSGGHPSDCTIASYVAGDLAPAGCDAFEDHLGDCIHCRHRLQHAAVIEEAMHAAADLVAEPAARKRRRGLGWFGGLEVAAAAAVVAMVALQPQLGSELGLDFDGAAQASVQRAAASEFEALACIPADPSADACESPRAPLLAQVDTRVFGSGWDDAPATFAPADFEMMVSDVCLDGEDPEAGICASAGVSSPDDDGRG